MTDKKEKTIVLIDAHAFIHRAFHALPPLTSRDGEPVGAVYGVASILIKLFKDLEPTHVIAAFDLPGKTFRHDAYEDYKAQRPDTPDDLISQFALVRKMFEAFNIEVRDAEGFEADDVIGTLAKKFSKTKDARIIIASGDHDTLQLVDKEKVLVYTMRKGMNDTVLYDEAAVLERYQFLPEQLPDFKGLKGDPSDNIIGVKGIGDKTATAIIHEYKNLTGLYEALSKKNFERPSWMTPRIEGLLREGEEDALFSRELALIQCDTPLEITLKEAEWNIADTTATAEAFLQKLHFPSLIERLRGITKKSSPEPELEQPTITGGTPKKPGEISSDIFKKILKEREITVFYEDESLIILFEENLYSISEKLHKELVKEIIKKKTQLIGHDVKRVLHFFGEQSRELEIQFDTLLADQLLRLNPTTLTLIEVARAWVGYEGENIYEAMMLTPSIIKRLGKELNVKNASKIYYGLELPLIPILAAMEDAGMGVDSKILIKLSKSLTKELELLEKKIHKLAGHEFNIASPKQLSEILFTEMDISTKGMKKTTTKAVSTASNELEKIGEEHEIVGEVLRYREVAKLLSTYITPLPRLIGQDKKIHTTFNQIGASTGRFSSQDPNLQNIPIRHKEGVEIRRAFVSGKGRSFLSFDYSQIELRIAAALSKDKIMLDVFKKGEDIHTATAAAIHGVALDKVTKDMRRQAKVVNFGIIYGMGSTALSQLLRISRTDASAYLDDYFETFSGVADYLEHTKNFAREHGYVETFYGRRRYIPAIKGGQFRAVREAERMATNMPVQGTGADIVKRAMIALEKEFGFRAGNPEIAMLLQVHDELLFEVEDKSIKKVTPIIKDIMEGASDLAVPLIVDVRSGKNWGDLA